MCLFHTWICMNYVFNNFSVLISIFYVNYSSIYTFIIAVRLRYIFWAPNVKITLSSLQDCKAVSNSMYAGTSHTVQMWFSNVLHALLWIPDDIEIRHWSWNTCLTSLHVNNINLFLCWWLRQKQCFISTGYFNILHAFLDEAVHKLLQEIQVYAYRSHCIGIIYKKCKRP